MLKLQSVFLLYCKRKKLLIKIFLAHYRYSTPIAKKSIPSLIHGHTLFMCRGHTLERVFVNLLLEVAEDEISFRTLVRDLKTKRPMLQLVLLSSKTCLSSGCCYENDIDGSHGTTDLQPSVKLLYSDYSNASEADLRYGLCTPHTFYDVCYTFHSKLN
jgi:hypothetical protein